MSDSDEQLHDRLVRLQEFHNVPNLRLANVARVHPNTVSKWRRGDQKPDAAALEAIAPELHTTTRYLLHGDNPPADSTRDSDGIERPLPRVLRTHRVRVWLSEFRHELVKAGVSDTRIREAMDLLTAPQVFSYYRGGSPGELTEDEAIVAMEAIGRFIRQTVTRRPRTKI